jgi:predicted transcriptional regulator
LANKNFTDRVTEKGFIVSQRRFPFASRLCAIESPCSRRCATGFGLRRGGLSERHFQNRRFARGADPRYREAVAKASKTDFDIPAPIDEEEDEETLAAIDEGIRDAEAGRTVPIEEVRKLLPKWITASSSRKER